MQDYLGKDIPKLGFGLMRLPMLEDEVDIEQTKQMVDLFLEHGYTYFDTAWGYLGGKSEAAVKTALVDRHPRESFQLATKLPAWSASTEAEAKEMFSTSLARTGAGYFDFYLLHNLGDTRTKFFDDFHIWDFLAEQKAKGLIRHLGFSMHDKADQLDAVLTMHPEIEFVQLQINYADWNSPSVESRKCYEVARKHQKPVVIMEPVRGGNLAEPPKAVAELFRQANPEASFASWALRYAASLEGLVTVLSGMSTLGQMQDNLATMDSFKPLDTAERAVIEKAQALLEASPSIPCTNCSYCVPDCPQGINIPLVFSAMNTWLVYENMPAAKGNYGWAAANGAKASACVACGQCEQACPQHIHIIDELKRATELLEV
ncbi:aldo/keto reductase [Ruminococcaceae bacterium OttesenSCG-928-D13]|nr:aldo/keto reductase [Ruminococcaceae bacterium OttesenSCG-928-D13]